jgi:hypothetical protein
MHGTHLVAMHDLLPLRSNQGQLQADYPKEVRCATQ